MKKLLARMGYALKGWRSFFTRDDNGRIQLLMAVGVVVAGLYLRVSKGEWLALLLCIALVLSLEMVNAAIEKLCDHLHPEQHPSIGKVKDMAAGAVLWSAAISAVIGLVILLPKFLVKVGLIS